MSQKNMKNNFEYKHVVGEEVLLPDSAVVAETWKCKKANTGVLASTRQIHGAAWAGGISGLLVGGPIGAVLLGWGGLHLAKKNPGDVGDFCRKVGDFMSRVGDVIKKEWNEASSKPSDPDDKLKELS